MISVSSDYVRAEVAEMCARVLAEGATAEQLRLALLGRASDMSVETIGWERAAIVFRGIANTIEEDGTGARDNEYASGPTLTVIEGGGGKSLEDDQS